MNKAKLEELQKTALKATQKARDIVQAAEDAGREMSPSEKADYDQALAEGRDYLQRIKTAKQDLAIFDGAKALADEVGGVDDGSRPREFKDSGKRLSFGSKMAAKAVRAMRGDGTIDAKALAPNRDTIIGQAFTDKPIELGKVGTTFLDALPVEPTSIPSWRYMRQTVRTNNAAVVAEGAVKPTSIYTMGEKEGSLKVIAHLSEAVPRYWLIDNDNLEDFLRSELEYGLQLAVEAKALADVNATSSIQTLGFSTDVLTTLRKSITKLEGVGYAPSYFLLHPDDWEALELLKDEEGRYYFGGPQSLGTRRLWDVPVIVSLAQTAGVSHTIASETLAVKTDTTGVTVQWSETSNADDFSKNLIRARCEGRFETEVYRPFGVVKGDLTA